MIDLTTNSFFVSGKHIPISKWVVWFVTTFGLTPNLEEAKMRCVASDIDPELNVTPVPVAIAEDGYYEIFMVRR